MQCIGLKYKIKKSYMYKFIGPLFTFSRATRLYLYDVLRYFKYSGTFKTYVESRLLPLSHSIERGLSLRNPKPNFGKDKIDELLNTITLLPNNPESLCAVSTLREYLKSNSNVCLHVELDGFPNNNTGGIIYFTKDNFIKYTKADFRVFSQSRYSIRDFTDEEVSLSSLKDAISIAQKAPSACNRQSTRVYIINDKSLIFRILKLQGGSNGFKRLVNKLLIITSDLRAFSGGHERNQSFIDAGLFGMALLYALHYLQLGACPLAWWPTSLQDRKLRQIASIDNHENIIFMISVGNIPKKFKAAKSYRKPIEEICYIR